MNIINFGLAFILFSVSVSVSAIGIASPYKGEEKRDIKALSQQEIDGYLQGKGMGLAKAAELNHYPGPMHVLDLKTQLSLSEEQIQQTQSIFTNMSKQASSLGAKLVDKERELDLEFANTSIDSNKLMTLLSEIGDLQTKIRYLHLNAHLQQKKLLKEKQIQTYDQLRGYTESTSHQHQHSH